ncbi:bleomycin resistance protein [Rhizobium deserti]|uniref:Bleomycin resistance protein n=2 Tax=Rhizobium deserti TaxID=2547961 RepID=A0A4R5U9E8_9HYPH|nr:bleomycin resistance protein [Rhizobium deserti]
MDHATPNLPSRDFEATFQFYASLGFQARWRDEGWMILTRGSIDLEFFLHPHLDPATSWFSCCLRLEDLDAFYATCLAENIPEATQGVPRTHKPVIDSNGLRMGALIDPDGTLIRLIQNDHE